MSHVYGSGGDLDRYLATLGGIMTSLVGSGDTCMGSGDTCTTAILVSNSKNEY
jgi:hypothetical protein